MNKALLAVFASFLVLSCPFVFANEPKKGTKDVNGYVFLYRESVEEYWNDWLGKDLSDGKVYILGEGKTAMFDGILHLNCENSSGYYWITAANGRDNFDISEAEIKRVVPVQVVSEAFDQFCSKK